MFTRLFFSVVVMIALLSDSGEAKAQWRDATGNIDDVVSQSVYFNDLAFLNPEFGFAIGNGSTILMFDGMGWRKQKSPPDAASSFFSISITPDTFGWIVGEGATFYQYNKLNNTWDANTKIDIATKDLDKKNKPMIDIRSVFTISKNNAWAVSSGENIFHFEGKKWQRVSCADVTEQLYGVTFIDNVGWAVGENGVIITNTDGRWRKVNSPTTHRLRSIFMESSSYGFAVGDNGTIVKYENGNWTEYMLNSPNSEEIRFRSVFVMNHNLAWAAGDKGIIFCWNGKEWAHCKEKVSNHILTRIWFTTAGQGWACGQNSLMNYEAAAIDEDANLHSAIEPTAPLLNQASLK